MKKSKASFTLIELLVVIAIIGVLTGFVFVSMQSTTNSAKDGRRKFDVATIVKAILMNYASSNNAPFPIESSCNIGSNCDANFTNYIPSLPHQPTDPQSGYYQYDSNGTTFTVCATLSNGHTYCYDSSVGNYAELIPVNGTCGTDTNLCSGGNLSNASGSSPSWTWDCSGIHGGTTSHCGAQEYATAGTYSWTVPATTSSIGYLAVVGGGGGGGRTGVGGGGGGGGGSGYQSIQSSVTVVSNSSLTITIGVAGAGASSSDYVGGNGGTTSISGTGVSFSGSGGIGGSGTYDCTNCGTGGAGQCNGGHGGDWTGSGGENGGCGGAGGAGGAGVGSYHGAGGGGGANGYGSLVVATAGGHGDGSGLGGAGGGPGVGYGAGGGGGGGKGPYGSGGVGGSGAPGYVKFIYQY